jgi:hypothetical protein
MSQSIFGFSSTGLLPLSGCGRAVHVSLDDLEPTEVARTTNRGQALIKRKALTLPGSLPQLIWCPQELVPYLFCQLGSKAVIRRLEERPANWTQ